MPTEFIGTRVEAIPGTPLPYGLLSVATMPEVTDTHELNGVEWQPLSCADASARGWCVDDLPEIEFDGSDVVRAEPISIFYAYGCNAIGQTDTEAADYARAGLAAGEQAAVESWLVNDLLPSEATDLTNGLGAVSVKRGISLLEGALARTAGIVGVLHVPADLAVWVGHEVELQGGRYHTTAGNLAAMGAGYVDAGGPVTDVAPTNPAPLGQFWMYATGPVIARRSPDVTVHPPSRDIANNQRGVIAERTWVVGYECAAFAVLINPTADGGLTPVS